uniref:50S ribosomal protein L23 n=1 Tax=Macrostomum lignano TaxID=282301 RepID=A0A1I8F7F9_9PLAT
MKLRLKEELANRLPQRLETPRAWTRVRR